jgi:CSLREA domain-containing protein
LVIVRPASSVAPVPRIERFGYPPNPTNTWGVIMRIPSILWAGLCLSLAGAAQGETNGRALASADFDGDGVPDLVVAAALPDGRGRISVRRGELGSVAPAWAGKPAAAWGEPIFEDLVPQAPRWMAAGDFDNDGHQDLVLLGEASRSLYLLAGDGRGGFAAPRAIELPGTATAMAAGEVNRRDNLADLVVAVDGKDGPRLLVFSGPQGALRAAAVELLLPWPAERIVLAQLDQHFAYDIAVAAGSELLLIQGGDTDFPAEDVPPLSRREAVALSAPVLDMTSLASSMAGRQDLAVLTADGVVHRVHGAGGAKAGNGRTPPAPHWSVERQPLGKSLTPAARLVAGRFAATAGESLRILDAGATFAIDKAGARWQIEQFATPRGAPADVMALRMTSSPLAQLLVLDKHGGLHPAGGAKGGATWLVNSADDIDDGTCDATHCSLREAIHAANAGSLDSIVFDIPAGPGAIPTITPIIALPTLTAPVIIDGSTQPAGFVEISGANLDDGLLGIDGLVVQGPGSLVRGLVINRFGGSFLIVAGNGSIVEGNRLGTNASGTAALGSAGSKDGVEVLGTDVVVGGTLGTSPGGACTGACNLIAGGGDDGLQIAPGASATVQGNFFSLDVAGNTILPGNSYNVEARGLVLFGAPVPHARNVLAGSSSENLSLRAGGGHIVQGNYLGTNSAGTVMLGSGSDAIGVWVPDGTIGGTAGVTPGGPCSGACNILSGATTQQGIEFNGSARRYVVQGNHVGVDVTGTVAMPNGQEGILVREDDTLIGGSVPQAANVIAGNQGDGIGISSSLSQGPIRIHGNLIGLAADGTTPLGNGGFGVRVVAGLPSAHQIGSIAPGTGNRIANGLAGVVTGSGMRGLLIRGNQIFANAGLGIDVDNDGLSPIADPALVDYTNRPELDGALTQQGQTQIAGTVWLPLEATADLDFYADSTCHPGGFGEGRTYLGSAVVEADAGGMTPFNSVLPVSADAGGVITATATVAGRGTSEFSACVEVETAEPVDLAIALAANPAIAPPGGDLEYRVTVSNLSGPGVVDATVALLLPSGSVFLGSSGAACNVSPGVAVCQPGAVAAGAVVAFEVQTRLSASLVDGQMVSASASVASFVEDPDPSNNSASVSVLIDAERIFGDGFEALP